jgi:DNA topoisomerase I
LIRVGNEEYARENGSFGLTTMRSRHVELDGATIEFKFRGKSGKRHSVTLHDRRLANVVKRCRDLPGHELFQYVDESGARQSIDSADVNDYLRDVSGESFTAKDFRTWAGTVLTFETLRDFGPAEDERAGKHNITRTIEHVAERLGNTPAVCRKCYVHPAVLEAYLEGSLVEGDSGVPGADEHRPGEQLLPQELAVLALLRRS